MRIVCPNCHATYEVPESILAGPPRMVRCARCGAEWAPEAAVAGPAPDPAPPAAPDHEPQAALPAPQSEPAPEPPAAPPPPLPAPGGRVEPKLSSYRPRGDAGEDDERLPPQDYESPPSRRGALIGWALTVALLAAFAWSAVSFRAHVMAAWPPSERVYGALGLR